LKTTAHSQPGSETGSSRRAWLYLLPCLLFPEALLIAAFLIIPTHWFITHSGNSYLENLAYATKLYGAHCDVVIWGDSSAMVGIDPAIVQARTGLSTCNIAEFKGMALVTNTLLLDIYLAHNARPRYLVIMFAPEAMFLNKSWAKTPTFEAITYLVQSQPILTSLHALVLHPVDTLGWAELGLRMTLTRLHSPAATEAELHVREAHNGQVPVSGSAEVSCEKEPREGTPDPAWLNGFRRKYGVDGTTVLVDATPTPSCDPGLSHNRKVLPPLIDNNPYPTLPYDFYIKGDRLHVNARGIPVLSNMVAGQILARMREPRK
jgi:hypothetical protein